MHQLNSILENKAINNLIATFKRSPMQLNKSHESDAEIIQLNDFNNTKLAITTDSISEEISTGLYEDPYLTGWMVVTVNMSDLAAVGADPIGILISEIIPENFDSGKIIHLQKGIKEACECYNTFVLGGDTNSGEKLILSGCAVGIIKDKKTISRIGCKPGDSLFSTGKLGAGNGVAVEKLISKKSNQIFYKPSARLREGKLINKYASCCMDSSDGFLSTLDQLMRLNNVGFEIVDNWEYSIDVESKLFASQNKIPSWLLLAGQHGEFELIYTIPQELEEEFLKESSENNFSMIKLGKVLPEPGIMLPLYENLLLIDTAKIRNLPLETGTDINLYLKKLMDYDSELIIAYYS